MLTFLLHFVHADFIPQGLQVVIDGVVYVINNGVLHAIL
jgi:hypothetical protein